MSSSSVTACSRSPSPSTPESSDIFDPNAFQQTLQSWYSTLAPEITKMEHQMWSKDPQELSQLLKKDELEALSFHDLIQEQVFDDMGVGDFPATYCPSAPAAGFDPMLTQHPVRVVQMSEVMYSPMNESSKPIPPPPPVPRTLNVAHKVVFPSKDTCLNLPIVIPNIPASGAKSRVETQIRLTVDLVHASTSSGYPVKYDRVGSWKCLKLPPGTSTKRRTRKEGKLDATPQETLYLTVEVTCASPPHMRVATCSSCQSREAKRAARKVAARVRPVPSDLDSPETVNSEKDAGCNLVQFNCPEELDFSCGSVILPMRITCYCRHHREKTGFNVHFKMMDQAGRTVGSGVTPPIMITDDHKSTSKAQPLPHALNAISPSEWSTLGPPGDPFETSSASRLPSRGTATSKRRSKPYDGRGISSRKLRKVEKSDSASPSVSHSSVPTRTSSPSISSGIQQVTPVTSGFPSPSVSFNSIGSPTDFVNGMYTQPDIPMSEFDNMLETVEYSNESSHSSTSASIPTPPESVCSPAVPPSVIAQQSLYFSYDPSPAPSSLPLPKIHRLIPACGPTHGGIEVTVLGANFHAQMRLNCLFGDVMASSTQRWGDNTLVCVLPARANPGVVAVGFDGIEKQEDGTPPCLFTYTDDSDRALMELALQVVGLKLNGKLEDARSVAMRIIGPSGSEPVIQSESTSTMQYVSNAANSLRPLLLTRYGNGEQLERSLINFLSILDVDINCGLSVSSAISHQNPSGQTLLHLASILKFSDLAVFLIQRDIDIDVRDRNGYTALHFAALVKSQECARVLVEAGAAEDIVNVLGKTPAEVAPAGFFDELIEESEDGDEEAAWGDIEDDDNFRYSASRVNTTSKVSQRVRNAENVTGVEEVEKEKISLEKDLTADDGKFCDGADTAPVDKTTAYITDLIQRTIAQLQNPQGMIPNVAQLPGMGVVPWSALPQMPAVFPIFVPVPAWMALWGEKNEGDGSATANQRKLGGPQLRAFWEKLVQNAAMATGNYKADGAEPPPPYEAPVDEANGEETVQYESDADEDGYGSNQSAMLHRRSGGRSSIRRVNYEDVPVPEQEVNAYGYRPPEKQAEKLRKKHDRMLILFWIPILLIGFVWLFFQSLRACYGIVKDMIPHGLWTKV